MMKYVLAVDDEKRWQTLFRSLFRSPHYHLQVTNDVEEAKNLVVESGQYLDIVIVNTHLIPEFPYETGIELLQFLQDRHSNIARIVITGDPEGPILEKFNPLDVDEILLKTCARTSDLPRIVDIAIDTRQKKSITGEKLEMKLSYTDRQRLIEELNRLQIWRDGEVMGEKSVLRAAGFPEDFLSKVMLSGNPFIDAQNLVPHLEEYGHLTNKPSHTALGTLVEYLLNTTPHIEGRMFLAYLIKRYHLVADLDYLTTLQERYALFEISEAKKLFDLGWSTKQPDFLWQRQIGTEELERIWSLRAQLLDAVFLEKGVQVAQAVCRIECPDGELGTGFTIGHSLVLTNNHVVPTDDEAKDAVVRFGYRVDKSGQLQDGQTYKIKQALKRSPNDKLDYVVLETEGSPGEDEYIGFLTPVNKSIQVGKSAFIIQHPLGDPKKVVLQDNWITYVADDHRRVQYLTNTDRGSSGSPVCNEHWEVIALHHSGGPIPHVPAMLNVRGNEGIPMMAILPEIQDLLGDVS